MGKTVTQAKAVRTPAKWQAFHSEAAAEFRGAEKSRQGAVVSAALDTHAAYTIGAIGGDSPLMSAKDFAADYGVQPSNVTLWRTLGHALVVVGFKPQTTEFAHLAHRGGGGYREVKEAVFAEDATVASVVAVMRKYLREDGSRISPSERNGESSASPSEGETVSRPTSLKAIGDAIAEAMTEATDIQRCNLALATLDRATRELETEDWSKVETALHALIQREVTIRAKQAADAAKPKPRKRTARKAAAKDAA